jgi:hypothetical protein
MNYLLGTKRDRQGATVLRGDPNQTAELIDSLFFAKKYTSGCLSFQETEISDDLKNRLMDEFEQSIFIGLDADQYDISWIEHTDKNGRIELNFIIPNVELYSGKRFQPYYHAADFKRISAWQDYINAEHDFADPHDPARKQIITIPKDLPKKKESIALTITESLKTLIQNGLVTDRETLVSALKESGFKVTRETKNSISIDVGDGVPIRLRGAIYERDFRSSVEFSEKNAAAIESYTNNRRERAKNSRIVYETESATKSDFHRKRFGRQRQQEPSENRIDGSENRFDGIENAVDFQSWPSSRRSDFDDTDVFHFENKRLVLNARKQVISNCIAATIAAARAAVARCVRACNNVVRASDFAFRAGEINAEKYREFRRNEHEQTAVVRNHYDDRNAISRRTM